MKGKISKIKNAEDELVLPVTTVEAIYMEDGKTKLSDEMKDVLKYEEFDNEDITAEIPSVKEEINGIKKDISEINSSLEDKASKTEAKNIQQQINDLVLGAVGDGNNAEVVQARGGYTVLNDRLNYIDIKTDDVIKSNLNTSFIVDKVDYFNFERKAFNKTINEWESLNSRATTKMPLELKIGDRITLRNFNNHSLSCYCFENGEMVYSPTWRTTQIDIIRNGNYYILIKKNDDTNFTDIELNELNNLVICYNSNGLITKNEKMNNRIDVIDKDIDLLYKDALKHLRNIPLEFKTYSGGQFVSSVTRCCTESPLKLKVGQVIKLDDPINFVYSVVTFDENGNNITFTSWRNEDLEVNSSYAEADSAYILLAYNDFREIKAEDLVRISRNLVITNYYAEVDTIETQLHFTKNNVLNVKDVFVDANKTVNGGEYYQKVLDGWEKETEYTLFLKTNDLNGNYKDLIFLREGVSSNRNMYRNNAIYLENGIYMVIFKTSNDETTNIFEILVDFRNKVNGIILSEIVLKETSFNLASNLTSNGNSELTLYVAPDGNDNNNGLSKSAPLLNINTAIQMGATTILCARGDYYNQAPIISTGATGRKLKIIPYENNTFSDNMPNRPLINLINGNKLETLVQTNGLLTQTLEPNEHIKEVFIDKTKNPIDTGNTRSIGYYSTIWQLHEDNTLDNKLKPVLTLKECNSEKGTFFHDGTNVYINPFETEYSSFILPNKSTMITLNSYSELILEDICCQFSYDDNFLLKNNMNMTVRNCHSRYTMLGNGFSLDNSNSNFYNCTAFKSRNDGFNIHHYGVMNFYNCSAYYNGDDGISHHDGCTGVIDGGEWHHNGKGGISSPTHGSYNDIYNVECHNNSYGIYAVSSAGKRQCRGRVFSSILYDNSTADIILQAADIKIYNTKYKTKGVSADSNLIEF